MATSPEKLRGAASSSSPVGTPPVGLLPSRAALRAAGLLTRRHAGRLALGFLLLLVALQAPIIAAVGVLTSLLGTAAAFGVARLIFQEGHGSGLLGFEPQGFLDAWGPVFFFAMIFAISMDYTVFLLSSAREHWEASGDPREAMIGDRPAVLDAADHPEEPSPRRLARHLEQRVPSEQGVGIGHDGFVGEVNNALVEGR